MDEVRTLYISITFSQTFVANKMSIGGAGNLRKPKDKEPTTKKSGFRLKGII